MPHGTRRTNLKREMRLWIPSLVRVCHSSKHCHSTTAMGFSVKSQHFLLLFNALLFKAIFGLHIRTVEPTCENEGWLSSLPLQTGKIILP